MQAFRAGSKAKVVAVTSTAQDVTLPESDTGYNLRIVTDNLFGVAVYGLLKETGDATPATASDGGHHYEWLPGITEVIARKPTEKVISLVSTANITVEITAGQGM